MTAGSAKTTASHRIAPGVGKSWALATQCCAICGCRIHAYRIFIINIQDPTHQHIGQFTHLHKQRERPRRKLILPVLIRPPDFVLGTPATSDRDDGYREAQGKPERINTAEVTA